MKPTLDDLRVALHDEAENAAYPDVDALVAGARRRVGAVRRRRVAALSAATAAVLLVGGLVATTGSTQRGALPPAGPGPGPFSLNAGGGGFPAYFDGMKRLMVLDVPMLNQSNASISVPTTAGRNLSVRMTCTPDNITKRVASWENKLVADFSPAGGRGARAQCDGDMGPMLTSIGRTVAGRTTVLADIFINYKDTPAATTLFKDARFHVAFYESVPFEDYPLPARPADLGTNPTYAWSSLPGSVRVLGPKTADAANQPLTFTQPYDRDLSLNLEVRGPGRMRVLINGTDAGEHVITTSMRYEDKRLTQSDVISFYTYQSFGSTLPLDPTFVSPNEPTPKPGTPVTVKVIPMDFAGPDWRLEVVRSQTPNGG